MKFRCAQAVQFTVVLEERVIFAPNVIEVKETPHKTCKAVANRSILYPLQRLKGPYLLQESKETLRMNSVIRLLKKLELVDSSDLDLALLHARYRGLQCTPSVGTWEFSDVCFFATSFG
jgi:hypothetical protein